MTREQDIRKEVLEQLHSAGIEIGKTPEQIARVANRLGFDALTPTEAKAACLFFVDRGHVAAMDTAAGVVRYRITADGILAKEREL
jgi:hypothetical protein